MSKKLLNQNLIKILKMLLSATIKESHEAKLSFPRLIDKFRDLCARSNEHSGPPT